MTIQERYDIRLISMNRCNTFIEFNLLIYHFPFNLILSQEFGTKATGLVTSFIEWPQRSLRKCHQTDKQNKA